MNKQTFPIPPNCKFITQELDLENNRIITTFEPEKNEFKSGDVISTPRAIIILNKHISDTTNDCYVKLYNNSYEKIEYNRNYNWSNETLVLANELEKQHLFDALTKEGKQWNPETLCIEDLKVIPKVGDCVKYKYSFQEPNYAVLSKNSYMWVKGQWLNCKDNKIMYNKCMFNAYDSVEILSKDQFQKELNDLGFEYNFDDDTIKELKWKPKEDEGYYYIDSTFKVGATVNNWGTDILRLDSNNCFKTKEECEEAIVKIKNILK